MFSWKLHSPYKLYYSYSVDELESAMLNVLKDFEDSYEKCTRLLRKPPHSSVLPAIKKYMGKCSNLIKIYNLINTNLQAMTDAHSDSGMEDHLRKGVAQINDQLESNRRSISRLVEEGERSEAHIEPEEVKLEEKEGHEGEDEKVQRLVNLVKEEGNIKSSDVRKLGKLAK